jgi:hypothetical protein
MKPEGTILTDLSEPFKVLPNFAKGWAADPMIFQYNGITYLFAELFEYNTSRGVIGVSIFDGKKFSEWKTVIKEKTHLSYPFLFCHNNNIYMMPESSESNSLSLYVAVDFPYKWKKEKNIVEGVQWVDTTIYRTGEEYYGFTETKTIPPVDFRIHLDDSLNFISKEVISQSGDNMHRCGGRMFSLNSKIFLVSQDCVKEYGSALIFRRLNSNLAEIENIRIAPEDVKLNRYMLRDGIHTYTATDEIEVIDIKTRRFSAINFVYRILRKVKKLLCA